MKDKYSVRYKVGYIQVTRTIDDRLVRQYDISINELPDLLELLLSKKYYLIENYSWNPITHTRYDMWEKEAGSRGN